MTSASLIKSKLYTKYLFYKKKAAFWFSRKSAHEHAFSMSKNEVAALEISVKVGCGLFCDYCAQNEYIENYKSKFPTDEKVLSEESFKSMLRNVPNSVYMKWTGFTEPLDTKLFPVLSAHLRDNGYRQQISTTLHGHPESVSWFCRNPEFFDQITLHLPDDSRLMKSRVTAAFLSNLESLLDKAARLGFGDDRLSVFLIGDDFHEGVARVLAERIERGTLRESQIQKAQVLNTRNSTVAVEKLGIANVTTRAFERAEGENYYCAYRRLNQGVLLPNGEVAICCQDYNLDFTLGNLKTDHIEALYSRIERSPDLAGKFLAGEFFPCTKCEHYKPVNTSFSGHLSPRKS